MGVAASGLRPAQGAKTLEEFDFTFQRSVKKTIIVEHLGQLDFLHARENVIRLGPPGTDRAVCVTRVGAVPTGFELDLVTLTPVDRDDLDPLLFGPPHHRRMDGSEDVPPDMLRFGLLFADGGTATNVGGFLPPEPDARLAAYAGAAPPILAPEQ